MIITTAISVASTFFTILTSTITALIAIAAILSLINIGLGIAVFLLAGILVFIEVYAVLNKKYAGSDNKLVYGVIAAALVFVLVAYFAFSKTYNWYLPKDAFSLGSFLKYFN